MAGKIALDPGKNRGKAPSKQKLRAHYQQNPLEWVALPNLLNIQLWEKQQEIFMSVWNNRYTACKSCYASGKSMVSAVLAIAWLHLWRDSIVVTTGPSTRQVRWGIWNNIHLLNERCKVPLGSELLQMQMKCGPSWEAIGFSTDDPGNINGQHAPSGKLLVIVDESAEVDAAIHERLSEALMTGDGCHRLDIGNPLDPTGPFYDMFHGDTAKLYKQFTISALETPNVVEGRPVVPGLVERTWVEERRIKWGEDSPMWKSRVLGEFPDAGDDTLIPMSWVRKAQERWLEMEQSGAEEYGVDLARYGENESVLAIKSGRYIHPMKTWRDASTSESVRYIESYVMKGRPIKVDEIGLGAGVVDEAKEKGLPVSGVNVQTKALDPEKFFNLRSELFWNLRESLNPENPEALGLPDDDLLATQLSSIKYRIVDSGGKIRIESKDDMKKRGVSSPDRADALMLACAPVGWDHVYPIQIGSGVSYWSEIS